MEKLMTHFNNILLKDPHVQKYLNAEKILIEHSLPHVIFAHQMDGNRKKVFYHAPTPVSSSRLYKINKRIGTKCLIHSVHKKVINNE